MCWRDERASKETAMAVVAMWEVNLSSKIWEVSLVSGKDIVMWARMEVSMAGLLCRGVMMWATMLGRRSDLLSGTRWVRREESWSELLVGRAAQWETKDMFCTASKESALWVRNDPAAGRGGARMERAEANMEMGRLVVEVLWDTMLFIIIPGFRLVVEVVV